MPNTAPTPTHADNGIKALVVILALELRANIIFIINPRCQPHRLGVRARIPEASTLSSDLQWIVHHSCPDHGSNASATALQALPAGIQQPRRETYLATASKP